MCVCVCVCARTCAQSCPTLCDPMDHQAPLSMRFPRQEYWSGLALPSPGDLPNPRIEPASPVAPALAGGFLQEYTIQNDLGIFLPLSPSYVQASESLQLAHGHTVGASWAELGPSFPGEGSIPVCHHGRLSPQSSQACISSLHVMRTVVVDQRAPSIRSQEWLLENCSFKLLVNLTDESNLISDTLKPGMQQYHCVDTIL